MPALSPGNGAAVTGRGRRIYARSGLDFWFDAVLLAAYTLADSIGFTGLAIHEWIGIALGLALLVHFAVHWDWVARTTAGCWPGAAGTGGAGRRAVRLLRQLAAATVTVAVIVALGVAWAHASGPGWHGAGPAAGAPQKFRVLPGTVASGRALPARAGWTAGSAWPVPGAWCGPRPPKPSSSRPWSRSALPGAAAPGAAAR